MDHKLIAEKEAALKEIKLTPAAGELPEPRVVHHIELTSCGPGSAWTGTLTSTVQRRTGKQTCHVCQQAVRLQAAGGDGCTEVDQDAAEDEGLKCRSCCRVRHFKCDALSRLEFSSLRTVSRRYICSSCLDLAIRCWKETSHVPSIGSTCLTDAAPVPENDVTKGLKETEVIPSKEEMKQMIREVVDDVIRSTISQVINQKVLVTCNACSSDSSGSGCECKVLPSVTSLDKQAEEETKTSKSEDLLLLLKSPDVEVKHFLPSCKPAADSLDQIVTQDIELKKRQILELVSLKSGGDRSSAACPESHGGNQDQDGGENGDANCGSRTSSKQCSSSRWSQGGDERQVHGDDAARDDLQDEIEEIGEDAEAEERADDGDDDFDAEEDAGEYESIRFDRQDLESKACLGFAHLDPHVDHQSAPGAARVAHNDREDQSDIRSALPIKLNQLDLSKFIRSLCYQADSLLSAHLQN